MYLGGSDNGDVYHELESAENARRARVNCLFLSCGALIGMAVGGLGMWGAVHVVCG